MKYPICNKDDSILEALIIMSEMGKPFCCVIEDGKFLGLICDPDIRKSLVKNIGMDAPLTDIVNTQPVTAPAGTSEQEIKALYQTTKKHFIPLINSKQELIDVIDCQSLFLKTLRRPNKVFIMAGGEGTRLRPITNSIPKPMIRLSGKPILENIISNATKSGFSHFVLCVNYMSEIIREYFGDGSRWGITIEYIIETTKLGTAGGLGLYSEPIDDEVLVLNADVLTGVDFDNLIDFHIEEKVYATIGVTDFHFQVPYGVIELENSRLIGLTEKPSYSYYVNAGIYVLSPSTFKYIPKNGYYDMTDLINEINQNNPRTIACYPIHEYWRDIACVEDYILAQSEEIINKEHYC